jgi:hypothetical protein
MNYLGTPRVVIPPSKRIPNWKSLPVEGAGRRERDRFGTALVVMALLIVAYFAGQLIFHHAASAASPLAAAQLAPAHDAGGSQGR